MKFIAGPFILLGLLSAITTGCITGPRTPSAQGGPPWTCYQTAAPFQPFLDIQSDLVLVYNDGATTMERCEQWQNAGYEMGMMMGLAWGNYQDYFGDRLEYHADSIQTYKDGKLFLHGPFQGYNVPTPEYIDYLKSIIDVGIDAGAGVICFEEPEFWVKAGWSDTFKRVWQAEYGIPWEAPDSSDAAEWRASKLKYRMYTDMIRELAGYISDRAAEEGRDIQCCIATHSLLNYAHWQIVSPESALAAIPGIDSYIAQVWTGTARQPNVYRGVEKSRTFETAFLEYGQMAGTTRGTDRTLWFLADPVEDHPGRTMEDYTENYQATLVASLLWPEVSHYEVMPWPERIFSEVLPATDKEPLRLAGRVPLAYAQEVLTVVNALNEMNSYKGTVDSEVQDVGILVSDTLMFQREAPGHSDWPMSCFYGVALPLVKAGIPLQPVQLEYAAQKGYLDRFRVLLLTYDGQKPPSPDVHDALARWVRNGGNLLYVGNGADPFHDVPEWWNDFGKNPAKACDDLFAKLGVIVSTEMDYRRVGRGSVGLVPERPIDLATDPSGADRLLAALDRMPVMNNRSYERRNSLVARRGPFIAAAVMDETPNERPLKIEGPLIELFDPEQPVVSSKVVLPGEQSLVYDLRWAARQGIKAKVLTASSRIRLERSDKQQFSFAAHGPENYPATAVVMLPAEPESVAATPRQPLHWTWDSVNRLLRIHYVNTAQSVQFEIQWN